MAIDFESIVGTSKQSDHTLGRFVYFSLASVLVDKKELSGLCEELNIPYTGSKRLSVNDAFRSATGDIKERLVKKDLTGTHIYQVYCRDNEHKDGILSRELVKETMNRTTNRYEKLANISFDKNDGAFRYDNIAYDPNVDALKFCQQAERLFELYQVCANRRQIETLCLNYINSLEAIKLSGKGHLYFVPRHYMDHVCTLEEFVSRVGKLNREDTRLFANSFCIENDPKQQTIMAEQFYESMKNEIQEYQEKVDELIKNSAQSPAVLERYVLKIRALETKKRHYEESLQQELNGLDDDYSELKFMAQELSVRAQNLRRMKRGGITGQMRAA